jgi:hypothetical protein
MGHGSEGIIAFLGGGTADIAMSLFASLARLGIWAFGWPLAPALALLAWRLPRTGLLWAMVAAAIAYRVLSPKAGVSPTGPVYLHEIVPILALLAAQGTVTWARRRGLGGRAVALFGAGALVSATMFLPGRLADLALMGLAQRTPHVLLDRAAAGRSLVFHEGVVPWATRLSWAYYPRHNSPALDDDVLFLHARRSDLAAAHELWRRRYPDRSAWWFEYAGGRPRLVPLDEALRTAPSAATPVS